MGGVDAYGREPLHYATPARTGPPGRIVLAEWDSENPFHRIPPRLLQKIKAYYVQEGFSKAMSFEDYLRGLHADDLTPDEVLDVIEGLMDDNPPREGRGD